MPARIVVAMSGGVDSSVAAYLLKQQGYEVIGLFMRTGSHAAEAAAPAHKRGCCSAMDARDARRVADRLDVPFYALDFEREFDRVIDYFTEEYLRGRTPNPCVMCNNWLKFGKLWSYGQQLEADFVATGHYAQVRETAAGPELHRGVDPGKDQSYVLFGLPRSLLGRVRFPIGGLGKQQVRVLAREAGLGVHDKPDSVEICFVPEGNHADFIRRRQPGRSSAGHIVDTSGKVLAEHQGIENFTIGQRKGLGFAAGARRYVLQLIETDGTVIVGDRDELLSSGLTATGVNWLIAPFADPITCIAKIRYRHAGARATVTLEPDGCARVHFHEPQSAVTPGQAVVFYEGSRVLGGGWIEKVVG
jgi:tRNA-specific 2-thiouridylase